MDIGSIAAWIQITLWIIALLLWLGRIFRGETPMPSWMKKMFSSNGLIGTVVALGLIMSAISLYMVYSTNVIPKSFTLNISAYDPPYTAPMRVISDQTFENQDVPLDGLIYENCTFSNVCFLYDGGSYGIHNSTVKTEWKICVKDSRLKNYLALMGATYSFSKKSKSTKKTVVTPFGP